MNVNQKLHRFLPEQCRGKLITITGIDGAGKSTLAQGVTEELRSRGHDSMYVYGRFLPMISLPAMEFGRRYVLTDTDVQEDYEQHHEEKQQLFDFDALSNVYELTIMMDYFPQLVYRVLKPLYKHDFVICDRFFYDTLLTDLAGDVVPDPESAVQKYQFYKRLVPSPDLEYYVNVPIEVAFERKNDIPDISYLRDRKRFYDYFTQEEDHIVMDGTRSAAELRSAVVADILDLK